MGNDEKRVTLGIVHLVLLVYTHMKWRHSFGGSEEVKATLNVVSAITGLRYT